MTFEERRTVLKAIDFGRGTAEHDDLLAEAFIETDVWQALLSGSTDVILGPKGSGKSALYAQLLRASRALSKRGIVTVAAEGTTDDQIFADATNANLRVRDFAGLWKLYFLVLAVSRLRELRIRDRELRSISERLQRDNLIPETEPASVRELFRRVLRYTTVEFDVGFGLPVHGTIALSEVPIDDHETVSVGRLLRQLGGVLARKRLNIWVLVDRLDTAFAGVGEDVEAAALRGLVQAYIDFAPRDYRLTPKLFLRDDIWFRISRNQSDRLAGANVIQPAFVRWNDDRLLALVAQRIGRTKQLCDLLGVPRDGVLQDHRTQRQALQRLLPNGAEWAFTSILNRLRDADGNATPRDLIRLMTEARSEQLSRLGVGATRYTGDELVEPGALRAALKRVSDDRLFLVMLAEYPDLRRFVTQLANGPANHTVNDLERLWSLDSDATRTVVYRLASLGLLSFNSPPINWCRIAPLYHQALGIERLYSTDLQLGAIPLPPPVRDLVPLVFGIEDDVREPRAAMLDVSSGLTLLILGEDGSGRSQLLRTIAGSIIRQCRVADAHIYVLDFHDGALGDMRNSPHCGGVVSGADELRLARLLNRLAAEARRRQELFAEGGFQNVYEQRQGSPKSVALPHVFLLVDGCEHIDKWASGTRERQYARQLLSLVREGERCGIHTILAGKSSPLGLDRQQDSIRMLILAAL